MVAFPIFYTIAANGQRIWLDINGLAADLPGTAPITIKDEGGTLTATPTVLDFVGAGVTATAVGDVVTITVPGSSVTQYTDEMAQDAVGAMVDGTLIYTDATPLLSRAALTGNVTAPSGSNVTTIAAGVVTEAMQVLANNTTQNVTSTKHGYTPISPADATQFLNGAATPAFTRVSAIKGTTTNDNAAAGDVGEYIESEVLVGSHVSVASDTSTDVTSISLTAGDWNVWGLVVNEIPGTAIGAAGWINDASATLPTLPSKGAEYIERYTMSNLSFAMPCGQRRFLLSATTTIYLGARQITSTGSNFAYGIICARRMR